ncbi:hypothetical protein ACFXPV_28905 [Streptomyces sp. NPDC059118]|uniref:hypothetical protein n=1 Tax=unclassified Streptomyces TaxID=2593676 RepID=UPI003682B849
MHDTHDFLSRLGRQTEALREDIEAARRERDEAATRLATLEMRLAGNTALLRAMRADTGGEDCAGNQADPDGAATGDEGDRRMSIEECMDPQASAHVADEHTLRARPDVDNIASRTS